MMYGIPRRNMRASTSRATRATVSVYSRERRQRSRVATRAAGERTDALGGQDFIYSQKSGVEETLFKGNILGVDADVADGSHRETEFRTFGDLEDGYHVPTRFLERVAVHVSKNVLKDKGALGATPTPLILGIWGEKGCGKTFNVELACRKMGMLPIVTSAGELEDSTAGEPGAMLRRRYLQAARAMRETGKLCCLIISDLDAGIGRFKDDLGTVNNQITHGTLMNICDDPTLVSEGTVWRTDFKSTNARVPIIVTGNDFGKLYAPLTRDGRMDLWMWEPNREEVVEMLEAMMQDDGLTRECCETLVDTFPNQPLDFFGAARARVYDDAVRELVLRVGLDGLNDALVGDERRRVALDRVDITLESLLRCGAEIVQEQENVNSIQLAREYMRWQEPEDLAQARRDEAVSKGESQLPIEIPVDDETRELIDGAKALMRAQAEERAKHAEPRPIVQEEEEEEPTLPWRVENIGEAQRLIESGHRAVDIRPMKDFNRETLKGAISCPAAIRTGGISDAVDNPAIDNMLDVISQDKRFDDKTAPIVVFHAAESSAAYHSVALRALAEIFDDVVEVDGGFPFYFKHFTPAGKRRPRYVGYGSENEETFWTASN